MTFEELYASHISLCLANSTDEAPQVQRGPGVPWVKDSSEAILVLSTDLDILRRVIKDETNYKDWIDWCKTINSENYRLDRLHYGWTSLLNDSFVLNEQIHRARLKIAHPDYALVRCVDQNGECKYIDSRHLIFAPLDGNLKREEKTHILLPPGVVNLAGAKPFTDVTNCFCWKSLLKEN